MTPAVRLEHFETLGECDKVNRANEKQRDTTRSDTTGLEPAAKPRGLGKKTKNQQSEAPGTSAKEVDPTEAVPTAKTKCQRLNPPSREPLSTKFGSALHPRSQAEWDQLCSATDMETGQLRGNVGTPDDPLFTYEEAVH